MTITDYYRLLQTTVTTVHSRKSDIHKTILLVGIIGAYVICCTAVRRRLLNIEVLTFVVAIAVVSVL